MEFTASAMVARRLMIFNDQLKLFREGKIARPKTALEAMEEDTVLLEGGRTSSCSKGASRPQQVKNDTVRLADLNRRLGQLHSSQAAADPTVREDKPVDDVKQSELVIQRQTVEISLELKLSPNTPIEGLVRRSNQVAETDRYLFNFENGSTFTIIDKWSNRSTTIWGDPHVDLSDVAGENNGDFKDLTASTDHTTLMLADGTRVTFTAEDTGIIAAVDIYKGSQSLHGLGAASKEWDGQENALFSEPVKESGAPYVSPGDVVYAGGDGNDWFDSAGKLVWGKTTGETATRPSVLLEIYFQQTTTLETARLQVDQAA